MSVSLKTTLAHFHNKLWSYYLPVPKAVGDQLIDGNSRRVICMIDGEHQIQGALMPKGEGYSIYVTNGLQKKLGKEEGDEVSITLEKDTSEFGHHLPETFEMLLADDEEGRKHFFNLTKGKQRSLVYIVGKVKSPESQISKGLAIMHHLKEAEGNLDFKRLNELIKHYNAMQKKG